jgi:hypothetical protein
MARSNSLGTATYAIWKTNSRECRTTFAPILISFSRNINKTRTPWFGQAQHLIGERSGAIGPREWGGSKYHCQGAGFLADNATLLCE